MSILKKEKFENIYMLKLYLKRIIVISSILKEYTQISDTEIVKKLRNSIELYLNELHKIPVISFRLFIY